MKDSSYQAKDVNPSLVRVGEEVQVDIHAKNGMLLLGKGGHVLTAKQKEKLLQLGVVLSKVESWQAPPPKKEEVTPPREFVLYEISHLIQRLSGVLRHALTFPDFSGSISDIADRLVELAKRQPDGLIASIFLVPYKNYSAAHCIHTAALVTLLCLREQRSPEQMRSAINAALTMNIAMMDLQDHLYDQSLPLTPEQQETIQSHPILGSALLRQCGVEDEIWHALVLYHHELHNGRGYPIGLSQSDIDPLAHWITLVDICCAKLTGRSYRSSILPARALAQMFREDNGAYDPTQTAMLIKELSIYPPGSFVRLASYEIGVVISRGKKGHEPRVAALRRADGPCYAEPLLRESKLSNFKVIEPVSSAEAKIRPSFLAKLWKM